MMINSQRFYIWLESPYFCTTKEPDPETGGCFSIKPGAPPDVQKAYDEFRAMMVAAKKNLIEY
jgi:hypothetical protein